MFAGRKVKDGCRTWKPWGIRQLWLVLLSTQIGPRGWRTQQNGSSKTQGMGWKRTGQGNFTHFWASCPSSNWALGHGLLRSLPPWICSVYSSEVGKDQARCLSWLSGDDWGDFMPFMVICEDRLVATMVSNGDYVFFLWLEISWLKIELYYGAFLKCSRRLLREHEIIKHKESLMVDSGSSLLN